MILSILIPTIPERETYLNELKEFLTKQSTEQVEILVLNDKKMFDGGMHTGEKRQLLLEMAKGKYVSFIDDDDLVTESYIPEILKAAETDCDVMGIRGWMTEDGRNSREFFIHLGMPYALINDIYYRHPNHLSPIKRDIALQVGYKNNLTHGEDYDYCFRLQEMKLCKTQTEIIPPLYHYRFSYNNKTHP